MISDDDISKYGVGGCQGRRGSVTLEGVIVAIFAGGVMYESLAEYRQRNIPVGSLISRI